MDSYKMIDYDHQQKGLPCNGNLSNLDGPFEAHWTFERQGQIATEKRALTDAAFGLLWGGIANSVSKGGVFWRCLVTDPTRLIDPDLYHVVTMTQVQDGRLQHRTFMVSSAETDPVLAAWLDVLSVPGSVGPDDTKPAPKGQAALEAETRHAEEAGEHDMVPA